MNEIDLRKVSREQRDTIRDRACEQYSWTKNVSQVARELGLNRQLIHQWIKLREKKGSVKEAARGPKRIVLPKAFQRKLITILAGRTPQDYDGHELFWSITSVYNVVCKEFDSIYHSPHIVRNVLHGFSFLKNKSIKQVVNRTYPQTSDLPAHEYAKLTGRRCFYLTRTQYYYLQHYNFYTFYSPRGDYHFLSSSCPQHSISGKQIVEFMREKYKKKLLILQDINSDLTDFVSDKVLLINVRRGEG